MVQPQSVTRFDGADVVPLMTADEARACVIEINNLESTKRVRLLELYERRGWVALGYATWGECLSVEFPQWGRRYAELQIEAGQIERRLVDANHGSHQPGTIPERQLRPLSVIPSVDQPIAWQRAHEIAEENDEVFSSRHVKQAVIEQIAPSAEYFEFEDDALDPPMESAQAAEIIYPLPRTNAGLFTSATPEWYTPRHIIDRVVEVFGEIDLDPCSNSCEAPNVPALNHFTAADDGLAREWFGRVYMNPPYGDEIPQWVDRLVLAYEGNEIDAAIALLPGRIDTNWFQPLWDYTLCVVKGRLRFSGAENSAPFPSVLVYMGLDIDGFMDAFEDIGVFVQRVTR